MFCSPTILMCLQGHEFFQSPVQTEIRKTAGKNNLASQFPLCLLVLRTPLDEDWLTPINRTLG